MTSTTSNPADAVREALDAHEAMLALRTLADNAGVPNIASVLDRCADVIAAQSARLAALAGAGSEPMAWTLIERVRRCGLMRHITQAMYDANPELHQWYEPYRCANCHAPAKAREDWQPMETADKSWSGERIDVWDGSERIADVWWGIPTYDGKEPGWIVRDDYDCNGPVDSYVRPAPTHWRPLPKPPAALATFAEGAE